MPELLNYFEDYIYSYRMVVRSKRAAVYEVKTLKNFGLVQSYDVFPLNKGTLVSNGLGGKALYPTYQAFFIHKSHTKFQVNMSFTDDDDKEKRKAKELAILHFATIR